MVCESVRFVMIRSRAPKGRLFVVTSFRFSVPAVVLGAPAVAGHAGAERLPKLTCGSCRFSAEQGLAISVRRIRVASAELRNVCAAGLPPRNDGSHVQRHGRLDSQLAYRVSRLPC